VRPYLEEFLAAMSSLFEIVIFTAASFDYTESVVRIIDPKGIFINCVRDRSCCTVIDGGLVVNDLWITRCIHSHSKLIMRFPFWNGMEKLMIQNLNTRL